jgi:hypothetical protein
MVFAIYVQQDRVSHVRDPRDWCLSRKTQHIRATTKIEHTFRLFPIRLAFIFHCLQTTPDYSCF